MSNFSSEIIYLHPDQITINRSQRQRIEIDTTDLIDSIRENGVINPIIIKLKSPSCGELSTFILIAGERRLESCRELGIDVPCRIVSGRDEIGEKVIELEENLKRKNLHWRDECLTIAELHNIYLAQDMTQTINQTAKSLSISPSHISDCITIAKYRNLALLNSATSIRQAMGLLTRFHLHQIDAISSVIADNPLPHYLIPEDPKPQILDIIDPWDDDVKSTTPITVTPEKSSPPNYIKNQKFKDYILELGGYERRIEQSTTPHMMHSSDRRKEIHNYQLISNIEFNFIHLDINFNHIDQYLNLSHRLMSPESHIMIWYKTLDDYEWIKEKTFYLDLILITDQPLIWFKPDIKEYESALIFGLNLQKKLNLRPYIYPAPTSNISTDKKPESMLRFFFQKILTTNTNFFDPCCGNGASLRAADSIGVNSILGLEPNEDLCLKGNELIQRDRLLRKRF